MNSELIEFKKLLQKPGISHCTLKRFCGWQIYVYKYDTNSPSGVVCIGGIEQSPHAEQIIKDLGIIYQPAGLSGNYMEFFTKD